MLAIPDVSPSFEPGQDSAGFTTDGLTEKVHICGNRIESQYGEAKFNGRESEVNITLEYSLLRNDNTIQEEIQK